VGITGEERIDGGIQAGSGSWQYDL
jgi:hypothetical protein